MTKDGMPAGFNWGGFAGDSSVTPNRFALVTEDSQFVRISVPPDTGKELATVFLREGIPAPTDWVALKISVKLRLRDYVQGVEPWQGVKVFVQFLDAQQQPLGGEVSAISLKEDTADWSSFNTEVQIPPGTESFTLSAGIFGSSGEVDIDDLAIFPVK